MKHFVTLVISIFISITFSYIAYANNQNDSFLNDENSIYENLLYIEDVGWVILEARGIDVSQIEIENEQDLYHYESYQYDYIYTSYGYFRFTKKFIAHATAYSPEQPYLSPYTFSGIPFTTGIVAVDPSVIPLGTYIYVPGFGLFLAADTGGAIVGKSVDLSFDTIREAIQFGRRDVTVYVLYKFTDLF